MKNQAENCPPNPGNPSQISDPEDLEVMTTHQPVVLQEGGKLDITMPILNPAGQAVAAAGITLQNTGAASQAELMQQAAAITQQLAAGLVDTGEFSAPSSSAPDPESNWSFEEDAAGGSAAGFTVASRQWQVIEDAGAPTGAQVIAQLAKNPDDVFNVLLADDTEFTDLDLSVQLRAIAGRVDRGGGVVWRARDGANYFVARRATAGQLVGRCHTVVGMPTVSARALFRSHEGYWPARYIGFSPAPLRCPAIETPRERLIRARSCGDTPRSRCTGTSRLRSRA